MKILLPPSEGKTPSTTGPTLDLDSLSAPELTPKRKQVMSALKKVSKRRDALEKLGVGASLTEDVERNTVLDEIPCAPALLTYSGVLYEAMDAGDLVAKADGDDSLRERLRDVQVFSALFGRVHGLDEIPAYRLAMKTDLGTLGKLTSFWKPVLAKSCPLDPAEVALDCRSSDYRSVWPGPHEQIVTMGAVSVSEGKRRVVSHWAKFYRGEFAGRLLSDGRPLPGTVDELMARAEESYEVEFTAPTKSKPANLMIVLRG
ncbi:MULTISPECIES: YaaA family protein [unclassified Brevibacterium]|uniref:YaaA family protein n=1 Tax=unclassified Brevibacterium TaxID=2614124 RepID=UPI0010922EF5|nr:peroxide stress protein YaaA [Brevibacterium sp. S22]TGD31333.1 peroxide stress protein YaaA [Brevibacterium sp. S22]